MPQNLAFPTVSKVEALIEDRFPALDGAILKTVHAFSELDTSGYANPDLCGVLVKDHKEALGNHEGLSEETRKEVLERYTQDGADIVFWQLTHAWLQEAAVYIDMLDALSDAEVQERYRPLEQRLASKSLQEAKDAEEAYFFNDTKADADFAYWNSVSVWTAEEATALSLGKQPSVVSQATLKKQLMRRYKSSPFAQEFNRRLLLIQRAQAGGDLPDPTPRDQFSTWAIKVGLEIPNVISSGTLKAKASKSRASIPIEPLELRSMQKIIVGLAKHLSGRSPHKEVSSIVSRLEGTGYSVHKSTVMNILRKAKHDISEG